MTVAEFEREWTRVARSAATATPVDEQRRQLLDEMIGFRLRVAAARAAGLDRDGGARCLPSRRRWCGASTRTGSKSTVPSSPSPMKRSRRPTPGGRRASGSSALPRSADLDRRREGQRSQRGARRRAEKALEEARRLPLAPPNFGALAVTYSEERASRYQGGDIGWLATGEANRWPPEVVTAIFALESPGALAPLVETAAGFYLVRLTAREESRLRPLANVRDALRSDLLREKHQMLRAAQSAALAARFPVAVDEALFEKLEPIAVRPPPLPGER